jgi:hypothetical protein
LKRKEEKKNRSVVWRIYDTIPSSAPWPPKEEYADNTFGHEEIKARDII